LWPLMPAAGHLLILGGLALILAEICLHGFQKIPFTCSYLPGKSPVHLSVLGGLGLLWYLSLSIRYERQILDYPAALAAVIAALAVLATCARLWTQSTARSEAAEVQFEDAPNPAVQELGINRLN